MVCHEILKLHDQNTQQANHAAIPRNRFPRVYATSMNVKIAELLSCHGNKARTIAYENFYREYRLKATDFGKQNQ